MDHLKATPQKRIMRAFVATSLAVLALPLAALAQTASTEPAVVEEKPVTYSHALRVPDDAFGNRPQAVILPTEPGEYREDVTRRSTAAKGTLPQKMRLLPEGYVIAARTTRIEQQDNWFIARPAALEGTPPVPPLRVLPNRHLAMLESILSQDKREPELIVTGRVTEFQGNNYILIEILAERSSASSGTPSKASDSKPATSETTTSEVATSEEVQQEPSAEDVIGQLLEERPMKSVVLPDQQKVAADAPPPSDDKNAKEEEGITFAEDTLLANRTGRVLQGKSWWTFAFEDLGDQPTHRPIRLLPNRLLESAIALSAGGTGGTVFHITGEITVHHGHNYMLLRKVIVRRDLGNFR